jgi:hypothetical protein
MSDCNTTSCRLDCDQVFMRVRVRPTIQHGTWVEWLLDPNFNDPMPHRYQLQVGHVGSNLSNDWTDVGLPALNASSLQDDLQRVYGKTQWTHYRIRLATPLGLYYSRPQHCWGDLSQHQWRLLLARERTWRVQFNQGGKGQKGWLLKRRLAGTQPEPGQGIIDYGTMEVVNPHAVETLGTEFVGGYYEPIPCMAADLTPMGRHERIEGEQRGTVNDSMRVAATMLAVPQVDTRDVWVSDANDFRWEIFEIKHLEEVGGVPVVISAELRLLPFSHLVYSKEITRG